MVVLNCNRYTPTEDITSLWNLPSYFPTPKVPNDNPITFEKIDLGRYLFYDKRLSGNETQACGTCHQQKFAFATSVPTDMGSTGIVLDRNSQGLTNVVYNPFLTWANQTLVSLEQQINVPLFGDAPVEMGINDANRSSILQKIASDPLYISKFTLAFGENQITYPNIIKAITTFERSLISANSKYDQYLLGKVSLTLVEKKGMDLFNSEKGECFHCHANFNFNDQIVHTGSSSIVAPFHNTGLYNIDGRGGYPAPNRGLFESTGNAKDMGAFRAPSLRNVELTAPYMHDGTVATLEDVLNIYAAHGRNITSGPYRGDGTQNPYKSPLVDLIQLVDEDKIAIIAFLKTLTDTSFVEDVNHSDPYIK